MSIKNCEHVRQRINYTVMEFVNLTQKLEDENARLTSENLGYDFALTQAHELVNNQSRKIIRLYGIIERAIERVKSHPLANGKLHSVIEILNEAEKGE